MYQPSAATFFTKLFKGLRLWVRMRAGLQLLIDCWVLFRAGECMMSVRMLLLTDI